MDLFTPHPFSRVSSTNRHRRAAEQRPAALLLERGSLQNSSTWRYHVHPRCRAAASTSNAGNATDHHVDLLTQPSQRPQPRDQAGLLLCQAPALKAPLQREQLADFRFWHDEKRFRGSGDVSLAQHMLFAAGGTRTGGNFKAAAAPGPMGWQVPGRWDVLWSTSDGALKAASFLKQGQLISTLPGTGCLSKKRHLAVTLHAAYGDSAWRMLPRTYRYSRTSNH
eukprot:GHRQ01025803.1.p1 GENE.GHRQ01025803.1~~GHRQ01025803.1.p1  ORF type:complete len:223 (+),score=64.41 GHRQ01025803.1:724-1392(+)